MAGRKATRRGSSVGVLGADGASLSALLNVLAEALADVVAAGVRCALVGGVAVGVRAYERTTRDVDLAVVCPDDGTAESLVRHLRARGYGLVQVLESVGTGRIATIRMTSPRSPRTLVHLLVLATGIEEEMAQDAELVEVAAGLTCPVAMRGHLVAMKVLSKSSLRPRDSEDLRELLREIPLDELERARAAARRIDVTGLHPRDPSPRSLKTPFGRSTTQPSLNRGRNARMAQLLQWDERRPPPIRWR